MELPRFLVSAFRRITGPFRHRAELHEILAAVTAKGEDHIPGSTGRPRSRKWIGIGRYRASAAWATCVFDIPFDRCNYYGLQRVTSEVCLRPRSRCWL